jgi:hypothetical protein
MMMKFTKYVFPLAAFMVWFAPGVVFGGLVGEPAPALNVREWIKGGPVEIKPGTNIFVVEIFETRLPASRASLTNLNEFQHRFNTNGVVFVAVSDEAPGIVKAYFAQYGSNIDFAVAADNGRHTALAFMKPINRGGIPYAFIIGTNGDLFWHGVPQHGLDTELDQIISGHYDEAVAKKLDLTQHQMEQYIGMARQGSDRTQMAGKTLLATRTNDVPLLCEMAYVISTVPALKIRDFALADEALNQAEQIAPTNSASVGIGRAIWLFESGKRDDGLARAKEVVALSQNPTEKTNLQMILDRMQTRMTALQSRGKNKSDALPAPEKDSGTNQSNMGTGDQGGNIVGKP